MKKDLKQLQNEFADYLLGNRQSPIREDIVSDSKADSEERLGFYHDAYRLRLIEVLSLDYPGLYKLLGDEKFARLALAYIHAFPSKYRSIRWFGIHFPEFLCNPGENYKIDEKLYETALFEKSQNDVFDAEQKPAVTQEMLEQINPQHWGGMRLEISPACRRIDLNWNVPQLWFELNDENRPTDYKPQWQRADYPVAWLVWRSGLDPHWRELEVDEAWAIDRLLAGESFGDVCEGLTEWLDEEHVPLRAVSILKTLIDGQLVSGISS
ncbi:MAG: putative DNA-binding domain-containing protein [Gammaproteobacteria bacterium]|nr:putative DNA-binding domain-containing protein [Gammaproteobacteria bacterium]